jgi:hypothetical protein
VPDRHGISDATFYKWRSKYGGMDVPDARKLKALEEENRKLKKLLAETVFDAEGDAGKKLLTPRARRTAVSWAMKGKGYSQRRACELVGIEAKTFRYASQRPDDGALRQRLNQHSPDEPGLRWPQSIDQPQNLREQMARHGDLSHLECDVASVGHDLRADLDAFLPQAGQRPVLDGFRQCQRPHEVGEILGQRLKLKPNSVGGEGAAGQPRPLQRVLAFLDPLLGCAALIPMSESTRAPLQLQCHPGNAGSGVMTRLRKDSV